MKDFSINNKTKVTAPTFPSLKIPKSVSATGYNKGKTIRNNIQGVLSKKYGGLDTKHIFDGIADIDIEKNIPVAETTIQTNVDRGFLDKNKLAKLPNLRDGLALSYAAADKGMNRAATRARDAAYMESNEPWLKETGTRLLSNDTSGMLKLESPFNINASKTADSKNESYAYKPKEEKTSGGDKPLGDVSSVQNPKIASSNNTGTTRIQPKTGIRFRAETNPDVMAIKDIAQNDGIPLRHAAVKHYSAKWDDVPEYKWTNDKFAKYLLSFMDEEYIHNEKIAFIKNYKDVIKDAAEKYDIPEILLAGVVYKEFGGDPMAADDYAYRGREFYSQLPDSDKNKIPDFVIEKLDLNKDKRLTSFGNTSVQIRRAAETLGYSEYDDEVIISILKDPVQNIYVSAAHLDDLRNIDYLGKSSGDLTDDEIKIVASRYNIGPQYEKEAITTSYGAEIYTHKDDILEALK